jgi:hypothetical protein
MDIKDAVHVIREYYVNGENLEVRQDGNWRIWYGAGRLSNLLDEIEKGAELRVKRNPRSIWAEQHGQQLTGACWPNEADALNERGDGNTIIEFREVLQ